LVGVALALAGGILGEANLAAQVTGQGTSSAPRVLSLDDALDLALEANPDLRLARLSLEEAEGMVSEAWSAVYPKIDFSSSYTRNISPSVSFLPAVIFDPNAGADELIRVQFGSDNLWTSSLTLDQPIFRAAALVGVGAAGRFQAYQEESVRGATHQVVTRIRVLYYGLLLAQEQARLIERSALRVAESLEETRALNDAGFSSDYDVLRLEVEFANLDPQLRRARNEALRMERDLAMELGLPQGTSVQVVGSLAQMDLENPEANAPENARLLEFGAGSGSPGDLATSVEDLLLRAAQDNSVVQQAGLNAELRNTELQLERAEYLPEISLFGSYDIVAQQNGGLDFFGDANQRAYGRNLGIRVTLPLFTGFQRGARVEQKQAALRSAQIERDLAEDRLRDEIRTLVEQVEEARFRAGSQRLAVSLAQRGFEIASAQYREGLGSQMELTDSEVALRQSEFNYAGAVYDYLSAWAELDRAVGEIPDAGY
jgi:outer membrane protein TolC